MASLTWLLVPIIIVAIYIIFKRKRLDGTVCWFCGQININVETSCKFRCSYCDQINGFNEDGNYLQEIPEMYAEQESRSPTKQNPFFSHPNLNGHPILCNICNTNQSILIEKLSQLPNDMPTSLLRKTKQCLEDSFPLCSTCNELVSLELERKNRQVRSLYLLSMRQQSNIFDVPTIPHFSKSTRELYIFLYVVSILLASIAVISYSCASINKKLKCFLMCQGLCFLSKSYEQFVGKYGILQLLGMSTSALREMFESVTNKGGNGLCLGSNMCLEHLYMQYDMKCSVCTDSVFVWSTLLLSPLLSVSVLGIHGYLFLQQKKISDRKNIIKSTASIFTSSLQYKNVHFHISMGVMASVLVVQVLHFRIIPFMSFPTNAVFSMSLWGNIIFVLCTFYSMMNDELLNVPPKPRVARPTTPLSKLHMRNIREIPQEIPQINDFTESLIKTPIFQMPTSSPKNFPPRENVQFSTISSSPKSFPPSDITFHSIMEDLSSLSLREEVSKKPPVVDMVHDILRPEQLFVQPTGQFNILRNWRFNCVLLSLSACLMRLSVTPSTELIFGLVYLVCVIGIVLIMSVVSFHRNFRISFVVMALCLGLALCVTLLDMLRYSYSTVLISRNWRWEVLLLGCTILWVTTNDR